MTAIVIVLVLGAAVLVASSALMLAERDMKSVIGDQQYALLSSAATFIDDRLETKMTLLASLAEAIPETVIEDPARLQGFLEAHPTTLGEFINLTATNADGDFVASLLPRPASLSARGTQYFEDTVAKGHGIISAPFRSRISGAPVVVVTQPVFDRQHKLRLVLIGGVDLQSANFLRQIDALRPGKTGYLYIMTTGGILIDHPNKARLLEHINARPGFNAATEKALNGFEGWTEAKNKDGSAGIYSYKRLKSTDWIVAARYPTEEAFAPMIELRTQAVLAAAACAALAGLLGWLATARLLAPLAGLRDSIAAVRARRASIGSLQVRGRDEIADLSRAFYALTAEREAAQIRTDDSERLTRAILDRAPDAFVSIDSESRILEWNRRAEETFGWRRDEVVGRNVAELIIPDYMRAAHMAGMKRFAETGTGPVLNSRVRVTGKHRDGREIPIELSVGVLEHGSTYFATAFLHDISDRLVYEDQIKASERRARIIADTMPALIAYIDKHERYQFTNAYYQELLGADPRSMLGRTVREVRGLAAYAQIEDKVAAALRGERMHFEYAGVENGRKVHFLIDYIPDVAPDGSVPGFYSMGLDISERKAAELRQAASQKRLKLITDNLPALISYIDEDYRFQFANATFQRWLGLSPENLVGKPIGEVASRGTMEAGLGHLKRAFAGEVVTFEFRSQRIGPERVIEATFIPDTREDGSVAGVYALALDTTKIKRAEEKLIQLARVDSLTGIANRRSFGESLAVALERSRRHHTLLALAYLDVDHFKKINDTHGHPTGDDVLKEFAARLVQVVRASDVAARLSGDEFVIVFTDMKDRDEVRAIAAKIMDVMRAPFPTRSGPLSVTTSVGIAMFEGGLQTQEALLANADNALYAAKRSGRNGYTVYGDAPADT